MSFTFRQVAFSEDDTTNSDLHANPETFTFTDDVAAGEWVIFTFFADPGVVVDGGVTGYDNPRTPPDYWCAPYFMVPINPGFGPGISGQVYPAQDYGQPYNSIFFQGSFIMLAQSDVPSGTSVLASWALAIPGDAVVTCGPRIYAAYVITPSPDFQSDGPTGIGGFNPVENGPAIANTQDTSAAPSITSTLANTDDWFLFWGTDQIFFLSFLAWEDDTITFSVDAPSTVMAAQSSPDVAHGGVIMLQQATAVNGDFYTVSGTLSGSTFWSMNLHDFPLSGLPPVTEFVVISQTRIRSDDAGSPSSPVGAPVVLRRTRFRVD